MSKREELRKRRRAHGRRQVLAVAGGVALVAVAVAAYLIWPSLQPVGVITPIIKQEYALEDGSALGPAAAPVVIQVFSDFQCPVCDSFAAGVEKQIIDAYIATGQVRLEYLHYLVIDQLRGGSESRRSAIASECAARQSEFWNYHDILYANRLGERAGSFTNQRLVAMAETVGLDMPAFNGCFNSSATAGLVDADAVLAAQLGVSGTPTVFINGAEVPGTSRDSFAFYQQRIDPLIGR